jgi:uncharacterized protein (DUF488 family)
VDQLALKARVWSAGYAAFDPVVFERLVVELNLTVADVRFRPSSQDPRWCRETLAKRLGARYRWIRDLGNRNYKGGPIELVDVDSGLEKLRTLLAAGDVVVLCVCADPARCHRTVVTSLLAAEGYDVAPLTPVVREAQLSLWPRTPI